MLEGLDSSKFFEYFEEICSIPRGSGNNTGISNYLVTFAKEHHLNYRQDAFENVIIWKPASKGAENQPAVMLQGHMDMVCEKEENCAHDFTKQGLELVVQDDKIFAKGTTLGGDDGIALAYMLAILDDEQLSHPPIEAVFTTDEETGMEGAIGLDTSDLKSKYFINLDSEEEGCMLTSCAGGMTVNGTFSLKREKKEGYVVSIGVDGLQGGHSGAEIDKNRENAVLLLGRVLTELLNAGVKFQLVTMSGGLKDNAIPRNANAKIMVSRVEDVKENVQSVFQMLRKELVNREEDVVFSVECSALETSEAIEGDLTEKILFFLEQVPNGIQKMSSAIPGLVESSLNLGICTCTESEFFTSFSIRSSVQSYKDYMGMKMKHLIENLGAVFEMKSQYPAWEYRVDSKLRNLMVPIYEAQYGEKPRIEAIHAGLECGILAQKMPELDMVSIGPDILDIHTPKETLIISSAKRVYQFVIAVLEQLSKEK